MTDWEKRARELFPWEDEQGFSAHRLKALQIGKEMADDRAEDIAKAIERHAERCLLALSNREPPETTRAKQDAILARSFISKEKIQDVMRGLLAGEEAAIRADEREKIAVKLRAEIEDGDWNRNAEASLSWVVETLAPPKQTREAVLEAALREILACPTPSDPTPSCRMEAIARRALEAK